MSKFVPNPFGVALAALCDFVWMLVQALQSKTAHEVSASADLSHAVAAGFLTCLIGVVILVIMALFFIAPRSQKIWSIMQEILSLLCFVGLIGFRIFDATVWGPNDWGDYLLDAFLVLIVFGFEPLIRRALKPKYGAGVTFAPVAPLSSTPLDLDVDPG